MNSQLPRGRSGLSFQIGRDQDRALRRLASADGVMNAERVLMKVLQFGAPVSAKSSRSSETSPFSN